MVRSPPPPPGSLGGQLGCRNSRVGVISVVAAAGGGWASTSLGKAQHLSDSISCFFKMGKRPHAVFGVMGMCSRPHPDGQDLARSEVGN